ncbi:MAG: TIGR01777 family oxidoreductase [Flectobacillus sp.]|nr:TIGR01777 family oxidoreductase [Flectobacillus sp.]
MKIVVAGGSGFLGKSLQKHWEEQGHDVVNLSRKPISKNDVFWDGLTLGVWLHVLEGASVLVNLSGKSVDCRYSDVNKQEIYESRIITTQLLEEALNSVANPPKLWINASSATIYIHAESQQMNEEGGIIGDDFSMNICKEWEKAFFSEDVSRIRKVAIRSSIVLGNEGGAFPKMKTIARIGLGGYQGNGNQLISWIHIVDFCKALDYIMQHEDLVGAINVTAPVPVTNKLFMRELRRRLRVPFGINTPIFMLELASILMQTETELLLKSRNVVPEKLLNHGFIFEYPVIQKAIEHLIYL